MPPLVPAELITQQRVTSRLAGETLDQVPQALAAAKSTGALIAERAAEDASELNRFVETIAEFFDCPSLSADHVRIRMREPYRELRALAARLNAEAERRGAPLGQTAAAGRDAGGRFIRGAR